MKLKKLQGIANNAVNVGDWCYPFVFITPPYEIEVDLLKGKLNPDMKGDDVEKFYKGISKWFHEVLAKEEISINTIEKAVIQIKPNARPKCVILAKGKTYSSES
jgi:hypothetical protein